MNGAPARRRISPGRFRAAVVAAGMLALSLPAAAQAGASVAAHSHRAAAAQDWPTYLQNNARTGATTGPAPTQKQAPNLTVKWAFQAGGPLATSATVVGTTAYIGAWDGYEYAISTRTGRRLWKTNLGTTVDAQCDPSVLGVTSAATVANGVVYVGGGDRYWYALNAATGKVLWKVFTGNNSPKSGHYNWSSPLILGRYAYIGIAGNCDNPLAQGKLLQVAISGPKTGKVIRAHDFVPDGEVGGGIWTSPTYDAATKSIWVSTGTLSQYTQTQSQAIVQLNASNLALKAVWQLPFGASISDSDWSTTPTMTTGSKGDLLVSVANKNGILYTFKRNDLAAGPVWQDQIAIGGTCPQCGDGNLPSGVFANGVLYNGTGNNDQHGHGAGGSINAINPGTGKIIWSRQTDGAVLGSPAYINGMLGYVEGKTFEVVSAANGHLIYSYLMTSGNYGAISIANGHFYVPTTGGTLYAFGKGSAPASPPPDPHCPSGFTCQDLGNPAKGRENTSGANLTVTAAGTGFAGTTDQFRFISKHVTGDAQTSTRIVAQAPPSGAAQQAGVMVRQTAAPGSPYYAVLDTPGASPPGVQVWYRGAWNGTPTMLASYPATAPVSVMIQRQRNQFTAGVSADGTNYTLIPGSTGDVDLTTTTMQGIAVASGSATKLGRATFTGTSVGAAVSTTMTRPPPADPCPAGWTCTDLGNPPILGDTTGSGGTLTLQGAGSGFGNASDSAHYVYQAVSGNASVSAQVATAAGASSATQDGIMMRESTAATAPMYSVYLNPGGVATIQWRYYDGVAYKHNIPLSSVTSPAYLKIIRWTDRRASPPATYFTTLTSANGTSWTPVLGSAVAIDMGRGSYLAGLVATSGDADVTTPATFTGATVGAVKSPPETACPKSFTCGDIGGVALLAGNQLYRKGNWTVLAGGTIYSTWDLFRFIRQPFPVASEPNGDGTVSVHVDTQQTGADPWMRSGVMIRSGTGPAAPYYGVFATPGHGVVVQWRARQGKLSPQITGNTATTPVWVRVSRYTDTTHHVVYYTAYTSADGVTWTPIPGSQVALHLPGPLLAGIASSSNSTTNLDVATFDGLAQGPPVPPPSLCPSSWACTDIGGALPPGTDSLSAGTWHVTGGGGDIYGTADAFHFDYQTLAADGTVTGHVTAQQDTSPWAKAGVMMRATTKAGSPYYGVFVTPGHGIAVQWRMTQGKNTSQRLASGAVPAYLKIGRYIRGHQIYYTAYTSADGTTWTPVPGSTQVLPMTGPLLAGIAVTSHDQGTASAVTLDTVGVSTAKLPPPTLCPRTWKCKDIGQVSPGPGSQTMSGGMWTVTGGGGDIFGTSDSFHFVYQPLAADGSMSARITSQTDTNVWAKGGLMMRLTTGPGSPYYAVFVTPGNGVAVQWRTVNGGTTTQIGTTGTVPVYLEITRTGTTFSAFTSTDGNAWTVVPGSTVTIAGLTGSLLRGFAVTSHDTSSLSTVDYDTVQTVP
jgi:outer membrane protein assembly factor BamB